MDIKKYICNICNKDYKTYKSMWHHKNKYHPDSKPIVNHIEMNSKPIVNQSNIKMDNEDSSNIENNKKYKCNFCSNKYLYKQSKWRHEIKCKKNHESKIKELIKQNEMKDNIKYKSTDGILDEDMKIIDL